MIIIMLTMVVVVVMLRERLTAQLGHEVREHVACCQCCFIGNDVEQELA